MPSQPFALCTRVRSVGINADLVYALPLLHVPPPLPLTPILQQYLTVCPAPCCCCPLPLQLSEAVIGYTNLEHAKVWQRLFSRPYFRVSLLPDPVGTEMCGTLKNIVAIGAGMVDGLGRGANAKAAIMRQGLKEMKEFSMVGAGTGERAVTGERTVCVWR